MPDLGIAIQQSLAKRDAAANIRAPVVQMVDECSAQVELARQAKAWLEHPFTRHMLKVCEQYESQAHYQMLSGKAHEGWYSGVWDALWKVYGEAPLVVRQGRDAEERLLAWSEDGTLKQAELQRYAPEEQ